MNNQSGQVLFGHERHSMVDSTSCWARMIVSRYRRVSSCAGQLIGQAWVVAVDSSNGIYSTAYPATALNSRCSMGRQFSVQPQLPLEAAPNDSLVFFDSFEAPCIRRASDTGFLPVSLFAFRAPTSDFPEMAAANIDAFLKSHQRRPASQATLSPLECAQR